MTDHTNSQTVERRAQKMKLDEILGYTPVENIREKSSTKDGDYEKV